MKQSPLAILTFICCTLLASCGDSAITKTAAKPYQAIANLIPRRVPIAEVRPEDLRKMPTGVERAQAWDRRLDSRRYAYALKHYKAPKLPDARSLPVGEGLLPPLHPGQDTTLEGRGSLSPD